MSKYVFVGDIHGKIEAVNEALSQDGHTVFVGDFLDSFDRTLEDHEKCLVAVLDACEKGEATALLGNHELSYLKPTQHRCSGYKTSTEAMLIPHLERIGKCLVPWFEPAENWLVTHAGLHPLVWKELPDTMYWDEAIKDLKSPLHWIGRYRGGRDPVGGIFWCDFNAEFEPIENLNQIFGHSRAKTYNIRVMKGVNSSNYCIDCLDTKQQFLTLDL